MPLINVENWISIFENFELPVGLYELGTTIIVFINLYFICGVSTGTYYGEKYPQLQLYVHFKRKFKHQKRRAILPYFETPAKYITKANFNGNVMEVS